MKSIGWKNDLFRTVCFGGTPAISDKPSTARAVDSHTAAAQSGEKRKTNTW